MAREVDPRIQNTKSDDETREALASASPEDQKYLLERPWTLDEYERQGFQEEVQAIREGAVQVKVPANGRDVTTERMAQGTRVRTQDGPSPNAVLGKSGEDDVDDVQDEYDAWTIADLRAEIEERNDEEGRSQKLNISGSKQDLVDRLRADDAAAESAPQG